jgi:hypothetical protein
MLCPPWGQLPAMPCAAAGTAVAVTHAPKARAASAPMGALLNNLAILYLLHSDTRGVATPGALQALDLFRTLNN